MQTTDIDTSQGRVRGTVDERSRRWLGIPYAAPPTGARRWLAPEPHAGWTGVRDALAVGPAALQHLSQLSEALPGGLAACREDCLTLSVYAPANGDGPLPVMVWLHGGGFSVGSGGQPTYAGDALARAGNVIVVTLNYRLGVLGFLRLAEATRGAIPNSGNEGLLDQVAALSWVADNIAGFGGDPGNVTLFGESAGAMSVATLMTMPRAQGLFHRAILQSGGAHSVHDMARAGRVAELFLRALPEPMRRDPRKADAAALVAASQMLHGRMMFDERLTIMPTRPVIDGDVLPALPMSAMRDGKAAAIPTIIGSNRDEWRYYLPVDKGIARLDHDGLMRRLQYHYDDGEIETLLARYDYAPGAPDAAMNVYCEITGDGAFTMPARLAARTLAPRQPVYVYRFDHPAPGMGGALGACHYSEVAYVFGTLDTPGTSVLFSDDSLSRDISARMQAAWTAFAHAGKPQPDAWRPLHETSDCYHFAAADSVWALAEDDRERFWANLADQRLQAI